MLKKALDGVLTPNESEMLISAFDQIGGIIIVQIPDALLPKKQIIGETLLAEVKVARSVFYQTSIVKGNFRTRDLKILAGEDNTKTQYRECGCRFVVDVQNAFFSPRLSTERARIADLAQDDETVINMFAGVGMFSIMAARKKKCTVYSLDINPVATDLCRQNIQLNKLAGQVIPVNGDASEIIQDRLLGASDRTLMLLPERSDEFLETAFSATRSGGIIHYYCHIHADRKSDAASLSEQHYLQQVNAIAPDIGSEIMGSRLVRPVGPRYYQTVVDARIYKQ